MPQHLPFFQRDAKTDAFEGKWEEWNGNVLNKGPFMDVTGWLERTRYFYLERILRTSVSSCDTYIIHVGLSVPRLAYL